MKYVTYYVTRRARDFYRVELVNNDYKILKLIDGVCNYIFIVTFYY